MTATDIALLLAPWAAVLWMLHEPGQGWALVRRAAAVTFMAGGVFLGGYRYGFGSRDCPDCAIAAEDAAGTWACALTTRPASYWHDWNHTYALDVCGDPAPAYGFREDEIGAMIQPRGWPSRVPGWEWVEVAGEDEAAAESWDHTQ